MLRFLQILNLLLAVQGTITSDQGCSCALVKNNITTPNATASSVAGCSSKLDWTGQRSEWCLTDQTLSQCGSFQNGFGYVDTCSVAGFPSVRVEASEKLEWDQTNTTFYTGQILNTLWTSMNIQSDEMIKITYMGASLRTLTPAQGVGVNTSFYSSRLSDTSSWITTAPVPVQLSTVSSVSVNGSSKESITVLQSKVMNALAVDTITGSVITTAQCNDGNISIVWRGLGSAQLGIATVTIKSSFGNTVVGTPVSVPASGNMTVRYILPRSFTPGGGGGGGGSYVAQISVAGPSSPYTASTANFQLTAAPSVTPTSTPSGTPTQTPTSSITPTQTPSVTNTPTSSATASVSLSPTPTSTVSAPPIDYAGIIAKEAAAANNNTTVIIASVCGSLALIGMAFAALLYYDRQIAIQKTRRRLITARNNSNIANVRATLYGVTEDMAIAPGYIGYKQSNIQGPNPLRSQSNRKIQS